MRILIILISLYFSLFAQTYSGSIHISDKSWNFSSTNGMTCQDVLNNQNIAWSYPEIHTNDSTSIVNCNAANGTKSWIYTSSTTSWFQRVPGCYATFNVLDQNVSTNCSTACTSPEVWNDSAKSCGCPLTSHDMVGISSSQCNLSDSYFAPKNGDTFLYTFAQYDTCRDMCAYDKQSCPSGQVVKDGVCAVPECSAPVGFDTKTFVTTSSACTMSNHDLSTPPDGVLTYIVDVKWNDCDSSCYAKVSICAKDEAIKNGICQKVVPPASGCSGVSDCVVQNLGLNGSGVCNMNCYCNNSVTPYFSASVSCGNDSNSTSGGTSGSDSNSTSGGDSGGTSGGDSGGTSGGISGGDSNSTSGGTSGGGTSGGDSNSTSGGTSGGGTSGGDSDGYNEDGTQAGLRGAIDGILGDIYGLLNGVKSDFDNLKNTLSGGLQAPNMSTGSAPTFCTVVWGRQICINLCDSFGQFRDVFYYMFVIIFMLTALRLYYLAFKMRT